VRTLLGAAGGSAPATRTDSSAGPYQPLSTRELEVLQLMATGAPNDQIARDLVVGVTTVKSHINGIFRKLGTANRLEAVARARAAGLLRRAG
jgi:LuxR family maltose regulon positive regulatory protein